jgi:hypothetical protein
LLTTAARLNENSSRASSLAKPHVLRRFSVARRHSMRAPSAAEYNHERTTYSEVVD